MPDPMSSNFGPKDKPMHDTALDEANAGEKDLLHRVEAAARKADDKATGMNAEYNGEPKSVSNAELDDPSLHQLSYGPNAHKDTSGSGDSSEAHGQSGPTIPSASNDQTRR